MINKKLGVTGCYLVFDCYVIFTTASFSIYVPVTGSLKCNEKQHKVGGDANHSSRDTGHTVLLHTGGWRSAGGSNPLFTKLRLCITSHRVSPAPGSLVYTQPCTTNKLKPGWPSVLLPSANKCRVTCPYQASDLLVIKQTFCMLHLQNYIFSLDNKAAAEFTSASGVLAKL